MSNPLPSLDRNKWARVNQLREREREREKIKRKPVSHSLRLHKIPLIFISSTRKSKKFKTTKSPLKQSNKRKEAENNKKIKFSIQEYIEK